MKLSPCCLGISCDYHGSYVRVLGKVSSDVESSPTLPILGISAADIINTESVHKII